MEENFLNRLFKTFKAEAEEHIEKISAGLLKLESNKNNDDHFFLIEELYREFHSLKGAARAIGIPEIETLCGNIESVFARLKKNEIKISNELLNNFHQSINLIKNYLDSENENEKQRISSQIDYAINNLYEISERIENNFVPDKNQNFNIEFENKLIKKENIFESLPAPDFAISPLNKAKNTIDATVKIPVAKMDSLLLQIEELITARTSAENIVKNIGEFQNQLQTFRKDFEKIKSRTILKSKNQHNENSFELNEIKEAMNKTYENIPALQEKVSLILKLALQNRNEINSRFRNIYDDIKETFIFKSSYLLDIFPKFVRDLSNELGKEIHFETSGGEVTADRRILDEMKEPLLHLLRNAIDHGIESADVRFGKGKDLKGKINLNVTNPGSSNIEIILQDDGQGINIDKVKAAAIKSGVLEQSKAESLSDEEAIKLIYLSDLSTSKVITDISGRGLGMAIVKNKIEKIGGTVSVNSQKDKGTTIKIILPSAFTTLRGIFIKTSERNFVIPSNKINQVLRIDSATIKTVENKETIIYENTPVSAVFLSDVLGLSRKNGKNKSHSYSAIILRDEENKIALIVDKVLDEKEILQKPFNKQLKRVKNFSGATISADGKVIPVLNVKDILESVKKGVRSAVSEIAEDEEISKNILVVDDSITSRILLKDILESRGYKISLAVDGNDAFNKIKTGNFDLVVSDIEMPKMDGFELTKAIKDDERFQEIPVVLVTALASLEDKAKGIDAGADAYIVKSSFEQSNLLEIVKRLI